MADNPADSHYDELDRLAARSLAAREAAAAAQAPGRPRALWPWALAGLLFVFALGLLGSPVLERELRSQLPPALQAEGSAPADPRVDALIERVSRLEAEGARPAATAAVPKDVNALALRLQAVESRAVAAESNDMNLIARLDALAAEVARTSSAVVETDGRTRDLFLLSVARRMLEAGRPLTPIEGVIDTRFRASDAVAVDALAAWSAAPQTKRTLASRLEALAEAPAPADSDGWWSRLKARLAGLVTVRGEKATVAADNRALMAQARAAMAAGDVGLAVSTLGAGNWPPAVREWIGDARALVAAEEALGRLESDALENDVGALQAAVRPSAN
jgi:hypothetical protein